MGSGRLPVQQQAASPGRQIDRREAEFEPDTTEQGRGTAKIVSFGTPRARDSGGGLTDLAFEGVGERTFRAVSQLRGERGDGHFVVRQRAPGEQHAPARQIGVRRYAGGGAEPYGEGRT
ncbi:hypothetical protein RKD42_006276 [Streptomyces ambofaciens]